MIEFMLEMTLVGSLVLAVVILASDSRRLANRLFALLASLFGLWSLGILLFHATTSAQYALQYAKLYYVAATIFPPLLAIFTWHYPRGTKIPKTLLWPAVAFGSILSSIFMFDDHAMILTLTREGGGWSATINQPIYLLFSIYFVAYFMIALVISARKYRQYRGAERMRAIFYLYGIILTSVPGFVANLILPYFGEYRYVWVGPVCSLFFLIASGYSIARHRLLDVKTFVAKSALYLLTILALASLYTIVVYFIISVLLGEMLSKEATLAANVTASLVVAFSFNPVRHWLDDWLQDLFHYKRYNSEKLVDEISSICVRVTDLPTLTNEIAERIQYAFESKYIAFLFHDRYHEDLVYGEVKKSQIDFTKIEAQYKRQQIESLASTTSRVFILTTSAQPLGYLVVGTQKDGRPYRREDEQLLGVVAAELSVAIQNIFRLEEIRSFAHTLEREVDAATKELRQSNQKLLEMDATKDEFVSMASHQLRTPLTSVKGYLSMVLEGDGGEITPVQRQLLGEAFTSSERMVHLVSDFLSVSRLQTGKFMIDRRVVDIAQLVEQEVEGIRQIAQTHEITLDYKTPKVMPLLYLDESKIRQVVMNFIDNAIYYSSERTTIKIVLTVEEGDVLFRVIDQGMGVPPDVQKKLFTKFFRAQNARKQRPDGTGIGLYLAKRIIDGHNGKIVFESQLGKGSTFGFRLPIKRLSIPPEPSEDDEDLPTQKTTP